MNESSSYKVHILNNNSVPRRTPGRRRLENCVRQNLPNHPLIDNILDMSEQDVTAIMKSPFLLLLTVLEAYDYAKWVSDEAICFQSTENLTTGLSLDYLPKYVNDEGHIEESAPMTLPAFRRTMTYFGFEISKKEPTHYNVGQTWRFKHKYGYFTKNNKQYLEMIQLRKQLANKPTKPREITTDHIEPSSKRSKITLERSSRPPALSFVDLTGDDSSSPSPSNTPIPPSPVSSSPMSSGIGTMSSGITPLIASLSTGGPAPQAQMSPVMNKVTICKLIPEKDWEDMNKRVEDGRELIQNQETELAELRGRIIILEKEKHEMRSKLDTRNIETLTTTLIEKIKQQSDENNKLQKQITTMEDEKHDLLSKQKFLIDTISTWAHKDNNDRASSQSIGCQVVTSTVSNKNDLQMLDLLREQISSRDETIRRLEAENRRMKSELGELSNVKQEDTGSSKLTIVED